MARPSHAPAPPYNPAVRTRSRVASRTPGQPTAGMPRRRRSGYDQTEDAEASIIPAYAGARAQDSPRLTTSASAYSHTEPLRATNKPIRHYTIPRRRFTAPKPATSPGDIAGRCTALAVALVSVTASVPPVTTAALRRTRRSPPCSVPGVCR